MKSSKPDDLVLKGLTGLDAKEQERLRAYLRGIQVQPPSNTVTWGTLTGKPNSVQGYNIGDVYTKNQVDILINKSIVAASGAGADSEYLLLNNDASLPNSRKFAYSSLLTATDTGPSGTYTLAVDSAKLAWTSGKLTIAVTATKTLTLAAAGDYTLTVPATGTAALLATANVFTAAQKINVNSTTALLVEQDGVKDNVLVVDTTNGSVGIGAAPTAPYILDVHHSPTSAATVIGVRFIGDNPSYGMGILIGSSGTNNFGIGYYIGATYRSLVTGTAYVNANTSVAQLSINTNAAIPIVFSTSDWVERVRINSNGGILITGGGDRVQGIFRGYSTQTNHVFEIQDSAAGIHNYLSVPGAAAALENTFNEQGSPYLDFRVESDTEANIVFLDASADTLYLGGTANGAVVEKAGDTYWIGTGGLPYGSFYGNDIAFSQATAAQNTWYDVFDADIADGNLNLFTHDGSGLLTATKAGKYLINYHAVCAVSVAGKEVQTGIAISGTESDAGLDHEVSKNINEKLSMGSTAIVTLTAGQTINISIRTTDTGTPDLSVEHINMTAIQVGG